MPETSTDHAGVLARTPLFSALSQAELAFLLERVVPRKCAAGEIVFSEGEPCAGLYVVESGSIRIFKSSPGGREQVLSMEGPGGSVAELPVFDGGNYPASVVAPGVVSRFRGIRGGPAPAHPSGEQYSLSASHWDGGRRVRDKQWSVVSEQWLVKPRALRFEDSN